MYHEIFEADTSATEAALVMNITIARCYVEFLLKSLVTLAR